MSSFKVKLVAVSELIWLTYLEHSKEGNHECRICGTRFYQIADLTKHVEDNHQNHEIFTTEKSSKCVICDEIFEHKDLKNHLLEIHFVKDETDISEDENLIENEF